MGEYFEIRNEFYKDAQGAIVVFDVGDRASFDALDRWLREANNHGANNLVLAICANKCDSKQRLVTEVEGKSGQPRAAHCTSRPLPRTARVCTACLRASSRAYARGDGRGALACYVWCLALGVCGVTACGRHCTRVDILSDCVENCAPRGD